MRYISTRAAAPVLPFDEVLLTGLAEDGGLYLPERWPSLSAGELRAMRGLSYPELAVRVMTPFIGGRIDEATFAALVRDSYQTFGNLTVKAQKRRVLTGEKESDELFQRFLGMEEGVLEPMSQSFARLSHDISVHRFLKAFGEESERVGVTGGQMTSQSFRTTPDALGLDG